MLFYGLFFLILGTLIIIFPNLLAYIVAFFFISLGINLLAVYFIFKQSSKNKSAIIIGKYKIIKK